MSETPIAVIVDCSDGTVTERPLTAEEIAQREADAAGQGFSPRQVGSPRPDR